ncbi:MAG: hypothetical protein RLZZ262_2339 [Bacteroidota bacterium]
MNQLSITETRNSPAVSFDGHSFVIKGVSTMVNAMEFYSTLFAVIDECAHEMPREMQIKINLCYFNSSSNKCLYLFLERVKRMIDKGFSISVTWCIEDEDEFMREGGQTIEELLGMQFYYEQVPYNSERLF